MKRLFAPTALLLASSVLFASPSSVQAMPAGVSLENGESDRFEKLIVDILRGLFDPEHCGECETLLRIDDKAFIDDMSRAAEARDLIARSNEAILGIFGELRSDPSYLICTTDECNDRLEISDVAGQALAHYRIYISTHGMDLETFVHERVHAEVAQRIGFTLHVSRALPMWFSEGIATYFAREDYPYDPRHDLTWILRTSSYDDWHKATDTMGADVTYGASAEAVHRMGVAYGWTSILDLIDLVARGDSFDAAFDQVGRHSLRSASSPR